MTRNAISKRHNFCLLLPIDMKFRDFKSFVENKNFMFGNILKDSSEGLDIKSYI